MHFVVKYKYSMIFIYQKGQSIALTGGEIS